MAYSDRTTLGRRRLALGLLATAGLIVLGTLSFLWATATIRDLVSSRTALSSVKQTLDVHLPGLCGRWQVTASPGVGLLKDFGRAVSVNALSNNDMWILGEVYGPKDLDDNQSHELLAVHIDSNSSKAYTLPAKLGSSFPVVRMISSDDVWATGPEDTKDGTPQLGHWDGSKWSIIQGPRPELSGTHSYISSLVTLGKADVWAFGSSYVANQGVQSVSESLVLHWDGSQWQRTAVPDAGGLGKSAAVGRSDIWVDGNGSMLHWDGSKWSKVGRPTGNIYDMAAPSADNVWAVGSTGPESNSELLSMHWNGSSWVTMPVPRPALPSTFRSAFRLELRGVTAKANDDVWAVGYQLGQTADFYSQQTIVLHWDGRSWAIVPSPNSEVSQSFADAVSLPTGEVWAVGQVGPDIDEKNILLTQFERTQCLNAVR